MCKKRKYVFGIDECMKDQIQFMNDIGIQTLACCCGHGKYPKTIVIKTEHEEIIEFYSGTKLGERKRNRYYKKDKQGYYYIPEVTNELLARDGKPYDVPNTDLIATDDELEIIQYLRPTGTRRRVLAKVGKNYVKKANNLIISTEVLIDGQIAIWVRHKNEPEEKERVEFAENCFDEKSEKNPNAVLKRMIDKYATRKGK